MLEPMQPIVSIKNRRVWRDLARILSTIFNPFLTALALFVILAHIGPHDIDEFWRLLLISTFFTSIGPMLYIFWLYASDRISDLDMSIRRERVAALSAFVLFYLIGTVVLWLVKAPIVMVAAMAGYAFSTLIVQYITRFWKISTHALGITAPLVALTMLFGRQPLPFMVLVPMVGWARVFLKAHTFMQVVGGCSLAIFSTILIFRLFHIAPL
ncbi:MAG TPA: phosphatase PAP2 family protein [Verrucomicrobiae bacterium]|nr:phosphatase PAP2 family protein [Verrucomicrobiae bacterium]